MSTCSDCYNGCTEIVSDRCVKYTGIDVPILGIQTGDSLSYVEQALITFLTSTLDGTGIKIDLVGVDICALVQNNLPTCGDLTIVDISKALIASACDLQVEIDAIVEQLAILNADYTIGCLTGVTSSSDTHSIVQAVITKLCQVQVDLTALALDLETNYVLISELDTLIQAYLDSQSTSTLIGNRMVPYSVVEYYGPLSYFDATGAGIVGTDWENIFLCNGLNNTPDKRGVVGVGVTDGSMLGNTMPAVTNPASGNPTYTFTPATVIGVNNVTLDITQIPAHSHTATSVITPNPHSHGLNQIKNNSNTFGDNGFFDQAELGSSTTLTTDNVTLAVATTIASQGGGLSHANYQPGLGCYYIQYRP